MATIESPIGPEDSRHIQFGTKAETLDRLQPLLKNAIILPQIHFKVSQWREYASNIVANIQRHFRDEKLIIRSSALNEDTLDSSNAGAFCSVLDVDRLNELSIRDAIERVIESYGEEDGHQILVQPQLSDVAICGVMFTCNIQNGAPYYVINYDESGATDKITSGVSDEQQTHYIYRHSSALPNDDRLAALIECARELEQITDNDALDIEYAFDRKQQLYLFQVRPLAQREIVERYRSSNIKSIIDETRTAINRCNERRGGIAGRRTILSDMSDWNPAELVGSHPRPLALSTFQFLITDSAWREARGELGYYNPANEKLLITLAGHPYVDVRNSFNSLLPGVLGASVRERVINESLDFLQAKPHLHDKVEFEVATNCFTPAIDDRKARYESAGLSGDQISVLRKTMLDHTEKLIRGEFRTLESYMEEIGQMDQARSVLLESKDSQNLLVTIRQLLVDCRQRGTKGFSAIARMAFIGNSFLRIFVSKGAISEQSYNAFLQAFQTVAGEMGQELALVRAGEIPLTTFLKKYGHLRPGTFDIVSPRYDEAADLYFGQGQTQHQDAVSQSEKSEFRWSAPELSAMQSMLRKSGSLLEIEEVLNFAKDSIIGRERAKFLFTRNVSDILQLVQEWGRQYSLGKDELAYLTIDDVLSSALTNGSDIGAELRMMIEQAKAQYQQEEHVILPELIADVSSIEHVSFVVSRPNFITQKRVLGKPVVLDGNQGGEHLRNQIVFIESADPGYDWIFMHHIAGLVTKYGGAASHMAIRCAEFGLPAAIGVGSRFEQLKSQALVEIDCANHSIRSLQ